METKTKMSNQENKKISKYPNTVSINELVRKAPHWFSEDNKRFFKSMWDSYALQNEGSIHAYFVSSEKHESSFANIHEPRKYTIRKFNMRTGDMVVTDDKKEPLFEFQHFTTKKQAEKAMREYMQVEPIETDKQAFLQDEIKEQEYTIKRTQAHIEELKEELKKLGITIS
jgi:hypothetical protein